MRVTFVAFEAADSFAQIHSEPYDLLDSNKDAAMKECKGFFPEPYYSHHFVFADTEKSSEAEWKRVYTEQRKVIRERSKGLPTRWGGWVLNKSLPVSLDFEAAPLSKAHSYQITLDRLQSQIEVNDWIRHLSDKDWGPANLPDFQQALKDLGLPRNQNQQDGTAMANFFRAGIPHRLPFGSEFISWNQLWEAFARYGKVGALRSTQYEDRTSELFRNGVLLIDGEQARSLGKIDFEIEYSLSRQHALQEFAKHFPEFEMLVTR